MAAVAPPPIVLLRKSATLVPSVPSTYLRVVEVGVLAAAVVPSVTLNVAAYGFGDRLKSDDDDDRGSSDL